MTFTLVLIAFVLTLAGAVKGLFGMGLPTVSMGLLGLMMSPLQAATLLVVPTLLSNVWQLAAGPSLRPLAMRFVWLMMTMALGTAIGIGFLTSTSPFVPMALGAVLAIYGLVGLFAAHFIVPVAHERWLSPAIGLISGVVNGATGISAIPMVPYLNSLGLTRDELIQALGLLFAASIIALSACLAWTDHLHVESMSASALTCIPVFVGMFAGQVIRTKLHADTFRRWFFIGLTVIGVYMAGKALFTWYLPA